MDLVSITSLQENGKNGTLSVNLPNHLCSPKSFIPVTKSPIESDALLSPHSTVEVPIFQYSQEDLEEIKVGQPEKD